MLWTQPTPRGASTRAEVDLLTTGTAILHNRLIHPVIVITTTTMLGAAATTTIIGVVHILIIALLLAEVLPLTLIKQWATQVTEAEVIQERV